MARRKRTDLPRLKMFIRNYVWGGPGVFGNITQSALAAGYGKGDPHSAGNYGCQLLNRKDVSAIVASEQGLRRAQIKHKALPVALKMMEMGESGDVSAAKVALQWAGELAENLKIEGGLTLDQLVPKRKPQPTEGSK